METLSGRLAELQRHSDAWWDAALTEIRQTAFKYEKKVNAKGITEVGALLHELSLTHTTREAQAYLNNRGLGSSPPPRAYALLISIAEAEAMDRSGVTLMWKLRKELQEPPPSPQAKQNRKQQTARLVEELQERRRLSVLRDKHGTLLTEPEKIALALQEHWSGIMTAGQKTVPECLHYIQSLPVSSSIKNVAKVLLKPLSMELVQTTLENMKQGSSPGLDGMPAEVFIALAGVMVPQMTETIAQLLEQGSRPRAWTEGLVAAIPKNQGSVSINALRPLCLQNVIFKWVTATIYLMMEDLVAYVTPTEQKAFIKGRFIFDHIWNVRGAWEGMSQGLVVSIDFAKAYEAMHHNYMTALFIHLAVPIPVIALLMTISRASFIFAAGRGVVKNIEVHPASGIKQGDLLSPALFVMACSVLVRALQQVSPNIHVLYYADDLLLSIPAPPSVVCALLTQVFETIRQYGVACRTMGKIRKKKKD